MIPCGNGLDVRGWGETNPLNGPNWSLSYEYIGNILYAFVLRRIGKTINVKGGFWWCSLILAAIFCIPCVGGEESILNGAYCAVSIIFIFPLILMTGAGSQIKGEISYPLYITHYPIMYMQMNWAWNNPDAPLYAHITVGISTILLSIGLAYACLKLYDIPVRQWLTEKWLKRGSAGK